MCVLHHGLWGNPGHLAYLIGELKKAFPSLVIANVDVNQALRTYDGIDVLGDKAVDWILDFVRDKPQISKVSFIGYSLV
ncbi:MAG: hypothetical protein SGCHY_000650 [Lobulomycetales sp.]